MFQGLQLCWHCQLLHWRVAQICLRFIMPQLLIGSSFAVSATASPHSSSLPECITSPRYWIFIIFQCCPGELSKKLFVKVWRKATFSRSSFNSLLWCSFCKDFAVFSGGKWGSLQHYWRPFDEPWSSWGGRRWRMARRGNLRGVGTANTHDTTRQRRDRRRYNSSCTAAAKICSGSSKIYHLSFPYPDIGFLKIFSSNMKMQLSENMGKSHQRCVGILGAFSSSPFEWCI